MNIEIVIGLWFLLGALGGLMWLYQLTDVFKNKAITFNDTRAYVTCLVLGFISFGFILLMTIVTFFEQHGDDSLFSWGNAPKQKRKKAINDPWRKADD